MESMLSMASAKMTGLDLGGSSSGGQAAGPTSSSKDSEMLTTPKFVVPENSLMSPKIFSASRKSSSHVNGSVANNNAYNEEVLTTPKTSELWPSSARGDSLPITSFSPDNLSPGTPLELGPRDPPKDLPMDSDIGLRSPCDGLLAKRRKFKTQKATSSNSVNSNDSNNSCDTPSSSQNSPRDLTMRNNSGSGGSGLPGNASNHQQDDLSSGNSVQVKLELDEPADTEIKGDFSSHKVKSISQKGPHKPSTFQNKDFKHPSNRPENLKFNLSSSTSNSSSSATTTTTSSTYSSSTSQELPSHYTPSPLAVPSPNWSAVEKIFGQDMLKTPKQLDSNNVFDFLTPPPITPRGTSGNSKLSKEESDRYSGRDQRLSPRLSPRFPIPEAPTDLSAKSDRSSPFGSGDPPPYPELAQDLSTKGQSSSRPSTTPTPPREQMMMMQVKQEFNPDESSLRSRTPSGQSSSGAAQANHLPLAPEMIKSEASEDYNDFSTRIAGTHHQQANFFLPQHLQSLYHQQQQHQHQQHAHRGGLHGLFSQPNHHQQFNSSVSNNSHHSLPPALSVRLHHSGSPPSAQNFQHPQPYWGAAADNGRPSSAQPPAWPPMSIKDDPDDQSVSPPSFHQQMQLQSHLLPLKSSSSPQIQRKRRGKSTSGSASSGSNNPDGPKKRNKGVKVSKCKDSSGPKKVYTCQHCNRSYDWNYNLNRHLKYECGKENAFQCAKCGRRFPHKQNCVYHLKRKHKVICDTIDQYMTAGLVLFRGSAGPAGQHTANSTLASTPTTLTTASSSSPS